MYNPKFDYKPIPRVVIEGKRFYATPDGNNLPSVTTILDKTKSQDKIEALNRWRKSVGVEKAQQITTEAANRGTRMHTYLEQYVRDGAIKDPGSNPYTWPSHAMAKVVVDKGLRNVSEFWGIEVPLYFPSIYAGTTDGAGIHLNEEAILDYKQTNKPKKREWIDDYFVQLAAYAAAHNETHGTTIDCGVILMAQQPDVLADGGLGKPVYTEYVIEGDEFAHWSNEWMKRVELYYLTR